ncbi:MAG: hypothetical protein HYU29_07310 [Chloroflexi bacterium]|nr:hypothetical protein [Chloroflexota bacterium]
MKALHMARPLVSRGTVLERVRARPITATHVEADGSGRGPVLEVTVDPKVINFLCQETDGGLLPLRGRRFYVEVLELDWWYDASRTELSHVDRTYGLGYPRNLVWLWLITEMPIYGLLVCGGELLEEGAAWRLDSYCDSRVFPVELTFPEPVHLAVCVNDTLAPGHFEDNNGRIRLRITCLDA